LSFDLYIGFIYWFNVNYIQMQKLYTLLLLTILSLSLSAQNIESKWISSSNENSFIELKKDGTFSIKLEADSIVRNGQWLLENNVLTLNYGSSNVPSIFDVDLTEKSLVLSDGHDVLNFDTLQTIVPKSEEKRSVTKMLPSEGLTLWGTIRGFIGLTILILILTLLSSNRKAISWKVVGIGLSSQIILAIGIQKVSFIQHFFEGASSFFVMVLDFTRSGSEFLFGGTEGFTNIGKYGFIFAFQVLPTIMFFSALTSVLFYLGIIQKVVYGLAWVMTKAMKISGAESLSVAGNIFLGQTESPLMIKAFLDKMNKSEILLVMTGGMATLAGGVLAAYISFLGGDDPAMRLMFAKQLLMASIMAAPGAVVASKILVPQTEKINLEVEVSKDKIGSNFLDAMSTGTSEGLKLAANVAAMLLVFVAFIAMFNSIIGGLGDWFHINQYVAGWTDGKYTELSLQLILGYIFAPLMYLIGVDSHDITLVGRLLGEKLIMSEFIGYVSLAELKGAGEFFQQKSIVISTFMLAGFANFASIGIQIGGIGSLAPSKRKQLSEYGVKALIAGTAASLISATIAGTIIG
jgi:CNT family concentrative nucleoside transporter